MDKETRKFSAWKRSNEEFLMFLMKHPAQWALCEKLALSENVEEAWENNPIRPILESYRELQCQMEDDLEERIFSVAAEFMPAE